MTSLLAVLLESLLYFQDRTCSISGLASELDLSKNQSESSILSRLRHELKPSDDSLAGLFKRSLSSSLSLKSYLLKPTGKKTARHLKPEQASNPAASSQQRKKRVQRPLDFDTIPKISFIIYNVPSFLVTGVAPCCNSSPRYD